VQPAAVDARGQRTVRLAPGSWQLLVSSPRYGVAEAALVVPEGLSDLLEVEVRMSPTAGASVLALAVVDPDGKPVVGAEVLSGKRVVGRTGEGGLLVVDGLGDRTALTVRHPGHTDYVDELRLQGSVLERTIELPWRPRSVGVTVTGPDGAPLTGASVQLVGPEDIEPVVSDAAGVASFEVRPGTWAVIAQRGDLGPARAEVVVPTTGAVSSVSLQLGEGELEVGDRTIALRRQVLFGFDSATLSPEADPVLDQVASALLSGGALRVEVQGHSDTVGDLAYNQALSSARAQAVRDALVARGVPAETLVARGYGPQRPVGDNRTEAGRAANRRVAFVIVERGAER
jgi:outer membrane protein OmpA-like peptidoglycan-associated protein